MSPGMRETLLSGEALANLLLPAPAAETRAEEEGIASAMPSSKQKKKRKSISSGGAFTAKKAKSKATKQRAADVQQPAFEAAQDSLDAIGEPMQQVPAAQGLLEMHANSMQIQGEEEQPAAEQDAILMEASAGKQQQDVAAYKIHQPAYHAEESSEDAMAGQWWLPQGGFLHHEEIKFAPAPERTDFGSLDLEAAYEHTPTSHDTTAAIARANFSPEAAVGAAEPAKRGQQQQKFGGADDGDEARAEELAIEIMETLTPKPARIDEQREGVRPPGVSPPGVDRRLRRPPEWAGRA